MNKGQRGGRQNQRQSGARQNQTRKKENDDIKDDKSPEKTETGVKSDEKTSSKTNIVKSPEKMKKGNITIIKNLKDDKSDEKDNENPDQSFEELLNNIKWQIPSNYPIEDKLLRLDIKTNLIDYRYLTDETSFIMSHDITHLLEYLPIDIECPKTTVEKIYTEIGLSLQYFFQKDKKEGYSNFRHLCKRTGIAEENTIKKFWEIILTKSPHTDDTENYGNFNLRNILEYLHIPKNKPRLIQSLNKIIHNHNQCPSCSKYYDDIETKFHNNIPYCEMCHRNAEVEELQQKIKSENPTFPIAAGVINIEYFIDRMRILHSMEPDREACDSFYDKILSEFSGYIIICREKNMLVFWMREMDGIRNTLIWKDYQIKGDVKGSYKASTVTKKFHTATGPDEIKKYDLLNDLQIYVHRLSAQYVVTDPKKPIYYEENGAKYFNCVKRRPHTNAEVIELVESKYSAEKIENSFNVIKKHLLHLSGNDKDFESLEAYIVMTFDETFSFDPRTAPIIVGSHGAGKTKFFNKIYSWAFGPAYTYEGKPKFEQLGMIDGIIGCRIAVLDELKLPSEDGYDLFKIMITENVINFRTLYRAVQKVKNNCLFFVLVNKDDPIAKLDIRERRFPLYVGTENMNREEQIKHFEELYDETPELMFPYYFIKKFNDVVYIENIKKTVKFDRIITNANEEKAKTMIDIIGRFVAQIFSDSPPIWYDPIVFLEKRSFYEDHFCEFCDQEGIAKRPNLETFYKIEGIKGLLYVEETRPSIQGKGKRPRKIVLLGKESIRDAFRMRYGNVDPETLEHSKNPNPYIKLYVEDPKNSQKINVEDPENSQKNDVEDDKDDEDYGIKKI